MKKVIILLSILLTSILFTGCNGDNNNSANDAINEQISKANSITIVDSNTSYSLTAQTGTNFQLFYGNSNHTGLGSLANVSTYDTLTDLNVSQTTIIDSRYPAMSTHFTYDGNNSYSNLYVNEISYIADEVAYAIDMTTGTKRVFRDLNVSGSHTKIDYLGAKQYLIIEDIDGNSSLIAPNAISSVPFNDRELEAVTYQSYGGSIDGYIVIYDDDADKTTINKLQKCDLNMTTCSDIADISSVTTISHGRAKTSYDMDFLGDILGTTKSIYISESKIIELDKSNGTITDRASVATGSTSFTLQGNEIFYMYMMNIYKTDLDGNIVQLSSDNLAMSFKAFTNDMVIYGGDTYMFAVAKDGGNVNTPIELSITTQTTGQKYPFDLGIGDQYLFTLYSVDPSTGKNTFYACKLEDAKKECRADSYWSSVTAKKEAILNNTSSYAYTPYAYIRVDTNVNDNYGGGKIKAIDPLHPLDDGISMGEISIFNFQTFVNSKYDNDMVDNNGSIVLYAKNDLDFRGNAYLVNLNQENSLKALTDEASPNQGTITGTKSHCHGRMCTVCHSFTGGKIYADATASSSSSGYTARFDFRDGSESILALLRKGTGENFNAPLESIYGKDFRVSIVNADDNATIVAQTRGYSHQGLAYFNCNYCHGRNGQLLHGAPNVINSDQ